LSTRTAIGIATTAANRYACFGFGFGFGSGSGSIFGLRDLIIVHLNAHT
jgi:hypothetical protein